MANWPENIVDDLRALAADGLSASQAATHFNGMTRNAAVGLAFRKGFHFHGKRAIQPRKVATRASAPSPPRDGQLILSELQHDSCRFIEREVHDPNHRYCGQQTGLDESWCPHHMTIVYIPREQRKR